MKMQAFLVVMAAIFLSTAVCSAALADAEPDREHEHEGGFQVASLIVPLGIITLCFVGATFASGLLRRRLGRRFMKVHLALAVIAVVLGLTHGILVMSLFD